LLHDLAVDIMHTNLTKTARLKKAAAGNTSNNMFTANIERVEIMSLVEVNACKTSSAEPDDFGLSIVQSTRPAPILDGRNEPLHRLLGLLCFSD